MATEAEAISVANEIGWDIPEHVQRVLSTDASIPSAICVYQFDDNGELCGARVIRDYDADDDDDSDDTSPVFDPAGDTVLV